MFRNKWFIYALVVNITGFAFPRIALSKSIYAITNHHAFEISAYEVISDSLDYQIDDEFPIAGSSGAVGLALDPTSSVLFVSYDGRTYLTLIHAKTMESIGSINMGIEFGGLVYDDNRDRLYAVHKEEAEKVSIYNFHSNNYT